MCGMTNGPQLRRWENPPNHASCPKVHRYPPPICSRWSTTIATSRLACCGTWCGPNPKASYDIRMNEAAHGKRYGTQTPEALEEVAKRRGVTSISLRVFSHNEGALTSSARRIRHHQHGGGQSFRFGRRPSKRLAGTPRLSTVSHRRSSAPGKIARGNRNPAACQSFLADTILALGPCP